MNKSRSKRNIKIFRVPTSRNWVAWCRSCSNRWGAPLTHAASTHLAVLTWAADHIRTEHGPR